MTNYDVYVLSIERIGKQMSLPIEPMSRQEFARAQVESDFVHSSVIDMDAFEAAFGR